jgi:hypothetical protein
MEKIKVMLAFDESKQIEYRVKGQSDWYQCRNPTWEWGTTAYRVAPAVPRKFTRWFIETPDGSLYGPYSDKAYAKSAQYLYGKSEVVAFEMTEILDAS